MLLLSPNKLGYFSGSMQDEVEELASPLHLHLAAFRWTGNWESSNNEGWFSSCFCPDGFLLVTVINFWKSFLNLKENLLKNLTTEQEEALQS